MEHEYRVNVARNLPSAVRHPITATPYRNSLKMNEPLQLEIFRGDITQLPVDAVVNAANTSLLGGGGVDGAIHCAAGSELLAACRKLNGCNTGDAKPTPGFNLSAKWVFHAVGPIWSGGTHDEPTLLARCYARALALAEERSLASLAFPAISTGVYGYPSQFAAEIAVATVRAHTPTTLRRIIFCCFDDSTAAIYRQLLD
jgi:O-acetyl-ADP-ribose deacetylase (regulator of RNase III)